QGEHRLPRVQEDRDRARAGGARTHPGAPRTDRPRCRARRPPRRQRAGTGGGRGDHGASTRGDAARMTPTAPAIQLEMFEGPLDLLLHLIKKNEVEIADIPIARITDQYLAMLEAHPALNLDGAGEYLVMAATLAYLKSRALLPESDPDPEEAEED